MLPAPGVRRHAPAARRNREALLAVLRRVLPQGARVLELGSGTGEHAVWLAPRLPGVLWQPSDPDPASRASIAAWIEEVRRAGGRPEPIAAEPLAVRPGAAEREGGGRVLPPLALDLLAPGWRLREAEAVVCVNVLHVAPPGAVEALAAGAHDVLPAAGVLVVAGPFGRSAPAIPPPLEAVVEAARRSDLALAEAAAWPDGCACAVFRRG